MKRVFLTIVFIAAATTIASAQTTTFYYPHIVDGVQSGPPPVTWKTTILLTNPAAGTASGTITFTQDSSSQGSSDLSTAGAPFPITLTDQNGNSSTGSTHPFSIPANGTLKLVSSGAGQFAGGFATVTTNTGTVSGTAIFSEFDSSGNLIGEAGVPSAAAVPRQAIFVDTQGNYKIGVAYANPNTNSANVTLKLLNSSAVAVVPTPVSQVLGPGNHTAAFTFQMFPTAPAMAGTMQITSDSPLAAIALRFDPSFSKFTTLPPVNLASLINPALEWLQQRMWLTPLSSVARLLGAFQLRIG
jgi:hypothetical protein